MQIKLRMAQTNFSFLTGLMVLLLVQRCMGQATIHTKPENKAGILSSTPEVVLQCRMSTSDSSEPTAYTWSVDTKEIYKNGKKQEGHELAGYVELSTPLEEEQWTNYDMVVKTTDSKVAVQYVCSGFTGGVIDNKAADVLLVESHPNCSQNKDIYTEGDTATISCEVRYHGRWGPGMTLTGPGQLEDNSEGNLVKWSIQLKVNPGNDGETFTCKTEYGAPSNPDPDEDASNKPDLPLNDCTRTIVVHYSARNTTIQQDSASVGDTLTCVSTANPPVEQNGFEWTVGGETSTGSEFKLEDRHQGELNITCCAKNTIDGQDCDEKISMPIVTTTSTTTTTTTTTTAAPDPTSGQSSPDPGESTGDDSLAAGAIAGIVVGCLILVLVLLLLFYYFCIHRNKKQDEANSTAPSSKANKPVHADQVRQPPQPNPYAVEDDTKPAYLYDDPNKNVSDGVVYADLALDNTPRSRNPIQVYEPTQYAEIRHPPPHV